MVYGFIIGGAFLLACISVSLTVLMIRREYREPDAALRLIGFYGTVIVEVGIIVSYVPIRLVSRWYSAESFAYDIPFIMALSLAAFAMFGGALAAQEYCARRYGIGEGIGHAAGADS